MTTFTRLLFTAAALIATPLALAQATHATPAKPAAKPAAKAAAKPAAKPAAAPVVDADDDDDGKPLDIQASTVTEFTCDHGTKISFYRNASDDDHVGVRFGKEILRMKRVSTTTGADRFESKKHGLVWIGIPTKSILLDSKKGQQVANGCRNAEQLLAQPQS